MSTLANSASGERGAYFGDGPDDPARQAFDAHAQPWTVGQTQGDALAPPVARIPPRDAGSGVAMSYPTFENSGSPVNVWTGMHGILPYPIVGPTGPDTQPAPDVARRNIRNAPTSPWDEQAIAPQGSFVSPYYLPPEIAG